MIDKANLPWRVEVDTDETRIEGRYTTVANNVSNDDAPLLANAHPLLNACKEALRHVEHKDVGHALVDHDGDDDNLTLAGMLRMVIAAAEDRKL